MLAIDWIRERRRRNSPQELPEREYDDPAYEVDLVLDNVTIGDLGRLPDGVAERAMRAYLRLIANIHAHTAVTDARYIQLAMVRAGIWQVTK